MPTGSGTGGFWFGMGKHGKLLQDMDLGIAPMRRHLVIHRSIAGSSRECRLERPPLERSGERGIRGVAAGQPEVIATAGSSAFHRRRLERGLFGGALESAGGANVRAKVELPCRTGLVLSMAALVLVLVLGMAYSFSYSAWRYSFSYSYSAWRYSYSYSAWRYSYPYSAWCTPRPVVAR